jgi:hypothetical protein
VKNALQIVAPERTIRRKGRRLTGVDFALCGSTQTEIHFPLFFTSGYFKGAQDSRSAAI